MYCLKGHIIRISSTAQLIIGSYPKAIADNVSATGSGSITIDALANDLGSGLTLTAPNAWSQKGGNVALVSNKITYKPKANFNGLDNIWYVLSDSLGRTNSGQVNSERVKHLAYQGDFATGQFFWRTTQQQEIDYIEEVGERMHAWEFKWNSKKRVKFPESFIKAYPHSERSLVTPTSHCF